MTWCTATVAAERLARFLAAIRTDGGTITSCCPQSRRHLRDVDDAVGVRRPRRGRLTCGRHAYCAERSADRSAIPSGCRANAFSASTS